MTTTHPPSPCVIILGGGATAFYAADRVMKAHYDVVILNEEIAIGGGTRYFVRYDKDPFKLGLLRKFIEILKNPRLRGYFGGVRVGRSGAVTLEELSQLRPAAMVLATGSRGKKDLGIPGKELPGVYDANQLAPAYNRAPGYDISQTQLGEKVVLLGMGNVVVDMIIWMADQKKETVKEITILGRRGPFESKIKPKEMKEMAPYLDFDDLLNELNRVLDLFYQNRSLPYFADQIPDEESGLLIPNPHPLIGNKEIDIPIALKALHLTHAMIHEHKVKCVLGPRVRFRFLTQPERLEPGSDGKLSQAILLENELVFDAAKKQIKARSLHRDEKPLPMDAFIYSIGSAPDPELGLPIVGGSFEADPASPCRVKPREGLSPLFMFGWARRASHGLVGEAKQDVDKGIPALLHFLMTAVAPDSANGVHLSAALENLLQSRGIHWTPKDPVIALHEQELAQGHLEESSFRTG